MSFLKWRETQNPPGGIIADEMGLGKTISILALLSDYKERDRGKVLLPRCFSTLGGTLIVVPTSIVSQWESEINNRTSNLTAMVFYGPKKTKNERDFAYADIVITTYEVARTSSLLRNVYWTRIVLDESHVIRNKNTQKSELVCLLPGKYRW